MYVSFSIYQLLFIYSKPQFVVSNEVSLLIELLLIDCLLDGNKAFPLL